MIKIETNKELAAFVVLIVVLCFGAFQIVYAKTINILSDSTIDVAYFTGKVGTNGNPPNRNLHLYNNKVNTEIDIQSVAGTNNHWAIYVDNGESNSLRFWNNNISGEKNILTINTRGGMSSVGIGTTNPAYKLDVNGSINASAGYYWAGSAGVSNTFSSNIVPTTFNIWNIWTSVSGVNTVNSPTIITVKNPSSQICYMYFTSGIFTSSTCP